MTKDQWFAIDHLATAWTVETPSHRASREAVRNGWPALATAIERVIADFAEDKQAADWIDPLRRTVRRSVS